MGQLFLKREQWRAGKKLITNFFKNRITRGGPSPRNELCIWKFGFENGTKRWFKTWFRTYYGEKVISKETKLDLRKLMVN